MSNPYVGEIRMFGGNFAPAGWALCDGRLLPISEYDVLFNLIGTTYGGDGRTTFGLPDLRGRVPLHQGDGYPLGASAGSQGVTLTSAQYPMHTHAFSCSANPGAQRNPAGNALATIVGGSAYSQNPADSALDPQSIAPYAGSDRSHENRQPFQCVSFIISLFGIYPTQN